MSCVLHWRYGTTKFPFLRINKVLVYCISKKNTSLMLLMNLVSLSHRWVYLIYLRVKFWNVHLLTSLIITRWLFTTDRVLKSTYVVLPQGWPGLTVHHWSNVEPTCCRCHLNDLENVIPFILIGLLYVTTSPTLSTAVLHFRLFTGSRLFHSVAYLLPLPQPARGLSFVIGFLTTLSMAYSTVSAVGFAL